MKFVSVDGDDVGQMIRSCYLNNDVIGLREINVLVQSKVRAIADFLQDNGFTIIFCAADGVAGCSDDSSWSDADLHLQINEIGAGTPTFSTGVGETLREAYVALLAAKSSGKARIYNYRSLI
jgi:hypothetical protein